MRVILLSVLLLVALLAAASPPELGRKGMVAADEAQCSAAGAELLARGGNAVDAAVGAALACGVTQPSASGLGGGGFALVQPAGGEPLAFDFREVAPAAATRTMFIEAAQKDASTLGGLAVAVPAEGPGLAALHKRLGRLPLSAVVEPAARLAEQGFATGFHLARSIAKEDALAQALFGLPRPPLRGDRVRRPALARTLRQMGKSGGASLQTGEGATALVAAIQKAGGVVTKADLAAWTPRERPAVRFSYRGWQGVTFPPPSSGGVVLAQILGVLEGYDLAALGHNSADALHLMAEAMKHAYADRARLMGDPDRVAVPVAALLSPARVAAVRAAIVPGRTFPPDRYGAPVDIGKDAGTQHISVLDAEGMAVGLTTTVNTAFGSKVIDPVTGIVLNNQMDDFVARPGEPNAFGLIGSEANAVAPGARPLSSMSPTVLRKGDRTLVVGASGGPFIISSTLSAIVNVIDFGMDPQAAVSAPRIHHQWSPNSLVVDEGIPEDVLRALRARGHELKVMPFFSAVQMIDGAPGAQLGASDPRKGGLPAGVR